MGWTTPRTYTTGEIITKTILDAHVRDNLKYLKGESGVPTIESGLIIDNAGGDEYLQIPSLTTVERDALIPVNGMIIYNETTTEFNKYEAGAWKDLGGGIDHGGLDGLADDDHTQYRLNSLLTTAGDIAYATAASTWARLGLGTLNYVLKAGATAPTWAALGVTQSKILDHTRDLTAASGNVAYTGYGFQPELLIIFAGQPGTSWGFGNSTVGMSMEITNTGAYAIQNVFIIYLLPSSGNYQIASIASLDADGFTLAWTKGGTPSGTAGFIVLALNF